MTIKELYELAVFKHIENYQLEIDDGLFICDVKPEHLCFYDESSLLYPCEVHIDLESVQNQE